MAVLLPFDVEISLLMGFDFAADTNLDAEFSVWLDDGGLEIPAFAGFGFIEDISRSYNCCRVWTCFQAPVCAG